PGAAPLALPACPPRRSSDLALCLLAHEPWLFGIGVLMIGMASAVFLLARQTYLVEAVPLTMRARAMSTLGGTMRIGLFFGPFIADRKSTRLNSSHVKTSYAV